MSKSTGGKKKKSFAKKPKEQNNDFPFKGTHAAIS